MVSKSFLKTAFLSSFLAISALSGAALADSENSDQDEYGMEIDPLCDYGLPEVLLKASGEIPSGQKASTENWDLEIYSNKQTKSWTLLGSRKGPDASDELCYMADGIEDPITEKWYQAYFSKSDTTRTIKAIKSGGRLP